MDQRGMNKSGSGSMLNQENAICRSYAHLIYPAAESKKSV